MLEDPYVDGKTRCKNWSRSTEPLSKTKSKLCSAHGWTC